MSRQVHTYNVDYNTSARCVTCEDRQDHRRWWSNRLQVQRRWRRRL